MNVLSALRRTYVGKTSDTDAVFGWNNGASGEVIYLKYGAGVSVDVKAVIWTGRLCPSLGQLSMMTRFRAISAGSNQLSPLA